jgi:DNA (cytosine-5)-methyltransferase 1
MVYYNEIDPSAAAWLRVLIERGLIAEGIVDERSIVDVRPSDLRGFDQCHFFAGVGGWSYALRLAGWSDSRPVWSGSCPCQPFSAAGRQRGSEDERHLWPAFFDLIRECRPGTVIGEQVAGSAGFAWWDHVAADLEGAGYAAAAANLGAHSVGAPHIRQRLYWVAHSQCSDGRGEYGRIVDCAPGSGKDQARQRKRIWSDSSDGGADGGMGDPFSARHEGRERPFDVELQGGSQPDGSTAASGFWGDLDWLPCADGKARPTQPGIFPLAHGLPEGLVRGGDRSMAPDADESQEARVMRLRGYGNAIVPQLAAAFIRAVNDMSATDNNTLHIDNTPRRDQDEELDEDVERDTLTLDMFGDAPSPSVPEQPEDAKPDETPAQLAHSERDQPTLFDDVEWWQQHWAGMPKFEQQDLAPWKSIMVHFESPGDFSKFQETIGQKLNETTKMCWYPQAEIGRFADKRWVEAAERNPVLMARRAKPKPPGSL